MTAQVYTDGSCLQGQTPAGVTYPGYGGWAAVCEHGHDGWVVRGRTYRTTNTRMELVAVVQGLRSLPPGVPATVHTDATLLLVIYDAWSHGRVAGRHALARGPRDAGLWREVAGELDARQVRFNLVRKGCDRQVYWAHRRAHVFAQYEARTARHLAEGDGQAPQEPRLATLDAYMPHYVRKLRTMDRRRQALQQPPSGGRPASPIVRAAMHGRPLQS